MINRIWRFLPFTDRAVGSQRKQARPQPPHSLRLEQLEERTLLNASPVEAAVFNAASPEFALTDLLLDTRNHSDLNLDLNRDMELDTERLDGSSVKTDWEILQEQGATKSGIITVTTLEDSLTLNPNDGAISLREAIVYAGTSELGSHIQFSVSGSISLAGALTISRSLLILGSNISLSCSTDRAFIITKSESSVVELRGLTIANCSSNIGGGVYNYGVITLTDCQITGCTSTSQGGGLVNNGGAMTLFGCTVKDNNASGPGGGIFNSGTLTMDGSTVTKNHSNSSGGGIVNTGRLNIINDSVISENTGGSSGFGGGIYNTGVSRIFSSSLSKNGSVQYGGGIANVNTGTLSIKDCSISENELALHSSAYYDSGTMGGGIFSNSGYITVADSDIYSNKADHGGGIAMSYVDDSSYRTVVLRTKVHNNYSTQTGGGISSIFITTVLIDSQVYQNSSDSIAGGVYDQGRRQFVYVNNSSLSDNTAKSNLGGNSKNYYSPLYVFTPINGYPSSWKASWLDQPEVTQAIITPPKHVSLLTDNCVELSASQSINAANYYWDMDGDGDYDDETGSSLVLRGEEHSGSGLTWEKLKSYGYMGGSTVIIGLKTVLAGSDENETDTMKYSTVHISITIPCSLLWGSYLIDESTNELRMDDWAVTPNNNQTNYYIDTIEVNKTFNDQYGYFLYEKFQLPDDWTTATNSIDTLNWKTGGTVTVTEIMPINAAFLCVCNPDGSILKAYEYLRGEPTVAAEIFARQIAYNSFEIGDRIWYYGKSEDDQPAKILTGYFVESSFNQQSGFNAYGLVSSYDDISPVLAIRGTEVKIKDILADANPQGVGYGQYQSAYSSVSDWMTLKESRNMYPSLVGHSLGGALCQWIAAAYVSEGKRLSGVTTFNSPGISQEFAEKFKQNSFLAGTVTHHIVNGDIVSMVGEAFIYGTNYLYSYNRVNVLDKHSIPVTLATICDENSIVLEKPKDLNSSVISTADLNSYWFHYTDKYYLGYLVAISGVSRIFTGPDNVVSSMAAKLFFRGTAEQLRKSVGSYVGLIYDFNEGQFSLTNDKYIAIDSIKLSDCWSINDTVIFWDTSKGNFFCSTNLAYTPAGTSLTGDRFSLGASVSLVSYQLNSIGVRFKNENIAMGNTGMFFQEASLDVNHLNDDSPITVTGMVRLTFGYEIHGQTPDWLGGFSFSGSLASFTGSLLVSSEQFSLRGDLYIPLGEVNGTSSYLVSANGMFMFNWNQDTIHFTGNIDLLNIQVAGFLTLAWGNVPKLEVGGTAAYTFPEGWWGIGGRTLASASVAFYYSGDSNPLNDYFFVGGTILKSGLGYRYTFDPNDSFWDNLDIIGTKKISREEAKIRQNAHVHTFAPAAALFNNSTAGAKAALPEPQERAAETLNGKLIVELAWETNYASTNAFLNLGNGSRISENDFALYGIALSEDLVSTSVAKRYLVDLDSFDFDNWTFEIESEGARIADSVSENWFVLLDPLSVAISAVDYETDGSMTISINAGYASDETVLSFYCDSENYNGLPLFQTTVGKLQDGKVNWKPENMTTGAYKLYVRAEDGDKYPAEAYFGDPIEIVCAPKLVVEDSSGVPDDGAIYWGTAVQNEFALAYRWEEFVVRNDGNATLTLTDWTLEGSGSKAFWFKAFDNDGNEINFYNTKLGVGETMTIRVGLSSSFNGDSQNGFTLAVDTNDADKPTLKLTGSVIFVKSVGTIAVSESSVGANEAITISMQKSGTYTVVLDSQPTADVTVHITAPAVVQTDVQILTFTAENWNVPQSISVSQVAASGDSETTAVIRHTIVSTDPNYNDGGLSDVVVTTGSGSDYEVVGVVVKAEDYKEGAKSGKTVGAETITDWDSFYVEFWSEGTADAPAEAVAYATIMYDQDLFTCSETFAVKTPDGLTGEIIKQSVNAETGQVTLTVEITIGSEGFTAPGEDLYWGCVYFTPTLTDGAGLADIYSETDSFGAKVKAFAYDLERNDKIDMTDFIEFAKIFNQKVEGNANPLVAVADFNGSGTVDMADFILFAQNFNKQKSDAIVNPKANEPAAAAIPAPAAIAACPEPVIQAVSVIPLTDATVESAIKTAAIKTAANKSTPEIKVVLPHTLQKAAGQPKSETAVLTRQMADEAILDLCENQYAAESVDAVQPKSSASDEESDFDETITYAAPHAPAVLEVKRIDSVFTELEALD